MSATQEPTAETLRMAYSEVCKGYYNVREIQLKLLAFIPVISGIAASLIIGKQIDTTRFEIVGILGVVFTIGVFIYGIRADQHAQSLISHGRSLEQALKLDSGQFTTRPKLYGRVLGYTTALSLIYAGLLLAWGYIMWFGLKS
jgi:hypothetical protein